MHVKEGKKDFQHCVNHYYACVCEEHLVCPPLSLFLSSNDIIIVIAQYITVYCARKNLDYRNSLSQNVEVQVACC